MLTKKKGYTLIEILVTISIIAFLITAIIYIFNTARMKQRDAKRLVDVQTIQKALDLYYDKNGSYPEQGVNQWSTGCGGNNVFSNTLQALVSEGFITEIPKDPLWGTGQDSLPYCYNYITRSDGIYNFCDQAPESTPYVLIFGTETAEPDYNISSLGAPKNAWCLFK